MRAGCGRQAGSSGCYAERWGTDECRIVNLDDGLWDTGRDGQNLLAAFITTAVAFPRVEVV